MRNYCSFLNCKLKKNISRLLIRFHQEIVTLKHSVYENSVHLNRKDVEVQELKKEVNNWSDKFKEQNHELHMVKTERDFVSKSLSEAKVCNNATTLFYKCTYFINGVFNNNRFFCRMI